MLWLLMTGKIPTEAETRQLSRELAERGELPEFIEKLIDSYVVVMLRFLELLWRICPQGFLLHFIL